LAARDDLIDLWVSIALHDEAAADRQLDRIEDGIRQLAEFPELGPARDELIPGVRAILRAPYLVLYRVDRERHCLDILRVIDARRDLEAVLHE
jgi:toxin ParE1/3/4